jgi:ribosomal protein S18 acetylase RimI-like enzyme
MAVDRVVRGQRWGRAVLDALVRAAQARGDAQVTLHAQCSAEGFYRRAGFVPVGAVFEEASPTSPCAAQAFLTILLIAACAYLASAKAFLV